jgi:UDP-glucose 4-epimerase
MDFRGQRVIVTGGAGFIGSHIVEELVARGARPTVVDNFSTGFREFVASNPNVEVIEGDLLDLDLLVRAFSGQDFAFHLAAHADIKDGLKHPRRDLEQNTIGTHNVLEAMRRNGVKRIAFTSTGSVYGEPSVFPTPEDCPFPIQTSLYSASKLAGEAMITSYVHGYGFQGWIFRYVSILGPRYSHGHIFDFYRRLQQNPKVLEVLGDGHQQKSYLHVEDCVSAVFTVLGKANEPINIFNIGHHEWLEVRDSVKIICRELGLEPEIRYQGGIRGWVGDSPRILLDTRKLRALGWTPRRTIQESVADTLRFLVSNPFLLERRDER